MSPWILWFITTTILTWILGNWLLAAIIAFVVVHLARSQYTGRSPNPLPFLQARREISELQRTVATNPDNAAAHNDLGRLLALKGNFSEALSHMEKAHKRSPESAETTFFYGYVLLALGKDEEGLPLIREALDVKATLRYGEPYLLTGTIFFDAGRFEDAVPWLERFTKMNTDSVEGYYKLGRCYAELGRNEEAKKALEEAAEAYQHAPRFIRRAQGPWNRKAKWYRRTRLRS